MHKLIEKYKTLFLPDIGTFFNNDIDMAFKMTNQLTNAGIPVLKGEVLHNAEICLKSKLSEFYYSSSKDQMVEENYREIIERKIVSLESYDKIFNNIKKQGCELVLSVYDNEGLDFALKHDVLAIKIASSNITHQNLIEYAAKTDKTIIIDTGHSSLEEIARAINWLNDNDKFDIIIQHSPLAPPVSVDEHNLKFMVTLGSCFNIPYGLSDHHISEEMLYAATALGACIVEKGVCPDEMVDDQDRAHALNISQAGIIQKKITNIAKGLGSGVRHLKRSRDKYRSRMGLIASKKIVEGDIITIDKISYAFPALGIKNEHAELILGRQANKAILKGQPIYWKDL